MNYQIKVIECEPSGLESALNQPASEGWQLMSCWPDAQRVRAVFQREAVAGSEPPATRPADQAAPPRQHSMPPDAALLDAVIEACRNQPQATGKNGKPLPPSIGLAKLAKEWGVKAPQIREKLQKLGVKENVANVSDHCHTRTYIWLYGNFVNIREAKRSSPTRP